MSRRKQAKPQHLRTGHDEAPGGLHFVRHDDSKEDVAREDPSGTGSSLCCEDTHVCHQCCAQFFDWNELSEHRKSCVENHPVLIVKDGKGDGASESPTEPSPVPSVESSDSSAGESALTDCDSLDEAMDVELGPQDKYASSPSPADSAETQQPLPNTNVTLGILHSTRVAVAQFSQGVGGGACGRVASAAIPLILEHLLALQQQQVHQLHLIEQICSQVATMNKQPGKEALNPVSRPLCLVANPYGVPSVSGKTPSDINGQAPASLSTVPEMSQNLPSETVCSQPVFRDVVCTSASSSENSASSLSDCSRVSALMPPYAGSHPSSSSQTLSSPNPLSLGQGSVSYLPHTLSKSVIYPNPLASIAATANALDPLAAMLKHRKGKPPSSSSFETKPGLEEPFFKHKCRFCAKVFGSDSALQIHLRSHTGERPFKCNICGNRFSTKGNLKVHFQRHKDKYPEVQMNPYPVPEYLDNVPTSSGIPYGMIVPPEKAVPSWLDSKPVFTTLSSSLGLPISSTRTGIEGSSEPSSTAPSVQTTYQPTFGECVSPSQRGSKARLSPVSDTRQSNQEEEGSSGIKTEEAHLPQSYTQIWRGTQVTQETSYTSLATTPEPVASLSPVSSSHSPLPGNPEDFSPGGLLDLMETSETSKLQQLVENIDKKIAEANQCVLCKRVLSCPSALKMHYRIHTGERPFKCKVCGRAFTTKGNLKTHVVVHRENPPVQVEHSCPICQKRFTNAVVLQQHIRMHMVGQITDSPPLDGGPETQGENEKNLDSPGSNDLVDDVSMEGDDAEEVQEGENVVSPSKSSLENHLMDSSVNLSTSGDKFLTNGYDDQIQIECSLTEKGMQNLGTTSPPATPPLSPAQSTEFWEHFAASVKKEQAKSGTQGITQLLTSGSTQSIKSEVNGYTEPYPTFASNLSATYPSVTSSEIAPLLGPPHPRRMPKQHNCSACGKNFSSASALQIHERTHTGEKPFVCSVCGRAFTTKGNLKVHMGTHMWNNTAARRGRRLSVDNPMALLGSNTVKFDLAARAMQVDAGFWSRYASAITSSLALKNNEISVIQNRGVTPLRPMTAGMDRVNGAARPITSLSKNGVELGNNRHFAMLSDDSKEIGIN